jgi:hypothetical protein
MRTTKRHRSPPALARALFACAALLGACSSDDAPGMRPGAATVPDDASVVDAREVSVVDATLRCASDRDCDDPDQPRCHRASGRCVRCLPSDDTCAPADHCDPASFECVQGCRADEGCPASVENWEGVDGGVPRSGRCEVNRHQCVDCLRNEHCPVGMLCAGGTCVLGCNANRACPAGTTCCDGGCVDIQRNTSNCGGCGRACNPPNGAPACILGRCGVATCAAPWGDCNADSTDGCETDTRGDVRNCGACGNTCPVRAGALSLCAFGRCEYRCAPGYADCDGSASNGCEVQLGSDPAHCGACGNTCALAGATAACNSGRCTVLSCGSGRANCNNLGDDGCEADLIADGRNCGQCGNVCPLRPNANAACAGARCAFTCLQGWGDCDGDPANGCETSLNSDPQRCGACLNRCQVPNASAACTMGRCAISTCATGFGDCDGNAANGCETDLTASSASCGACGNVCPAGFVCSLGSCRSSCASTTTYCNGGCVDLATSAQNCGACGNACPIPGNATPRCTSGACGFVCATGMSDCDRNPVNGCETDLRSASRHCGTCGNTCPARANATPVCAGGSCGYTCANGYADCNADPLDGCETELGRDPQHCGACGRACNLPRAASTTCLAGACAVTTCMAGSADCDGDANNGCEADLAVDGRHCGACNRACGDGMACQNRLCTAFPSTGVNGAFAPTANTVLAPGTYHFTTIQVPPGVTITTSGQGVLDLRATGDVWIRGTLDVTGGRGGEGTMCNGAGGVGGASASPVATLSSDSRMDNLGGVGGLGGLGAAGLPGMGLSSCIGQPGNLGGGGGGGVSSATTPACGGGGGGGQGGGGGGGGGVCCNPTLAGRPVFGGGGGGGFSGGLGAQPGGGGQGGRSGNILYDGESGAAAGCADGTISLGAGGGGGGSVGAAALTDLGMLTTFAPGSGGGGGGGGHGQGGGGAGGALRLSSTTAIVIEGRILANGGRGGDGACCGGGGGGGSGGAVMLYAPSVLTGSSALISAVGGRGGNADGIRAGAGGNGGLGRVRITVNRTTCSLSGTFNPPLSNGCTPTPGGVPGRVFVGPFSN